MEDLTLSSRAEVHNSYRIDHHSLPELLERVMTMPSRRGKTGEPQTKQNPEKRYLTSA